MKRIFLIFVIVLPLLASCSNGRDVREPNVRDELVINGLSDDHWTYFSIETGQVVGQSAFRNEDEDKLWAERKDWDFAICGDCLRTNSGDSGVGFGGIQRIHSGTFDQLETVPDAGYLTDEKK